MTVALIVAVELVDFVILGVSSERPERDQDPHFGASILKSFVSEMSDPPVEPSFSDLRSICPSNANAEELSAAPGFQQA